MWSECIWCVGVYACLGQRGRSVMLSEIPGPSVLRMLVPLRGSTWQNNSVVPDYRLRPDGISGILLILVSFPYLLRVFDGLGEASIICERCSFHPLMCVYYDLLQHVLNCEWSRPTLSATNIFFLNTSRTVFFVLIDRWQGYILYFMTIVQKFTPTCVKLRAKSADIFF